MDAGGNLHHYSIEEILPYFVEFPRERFCSNFEGLVCCCYLPQHMRDGNLDINQFKKVIQVVLKSPIDLLEFKIFIIKPQYPSQFYFGSDTGCEIRIEHPTVSNRHAMLNLVSNTEMWLTDLKSRFGTMINERSVFPDIKTPIKTNDNITFGLARVFFKTANWLHSSLSTRFSGRINDKFERIVIRYLNGTIRKRIINDINIEIDRFTIRNVLTGKLESYTTTDLKAIFWVKNLIGDPSRVDKQGFIKEADPSNIFIEFKDNECQWGSQTGYSNKATGFFFYPHDPDSNNIKCYIPRNALNYVLL